MRVPLAHERFMAFIIARRFISRYNPPHASLVNHFYAVFTAGPDYLGRRVGILQA